jgi:hypothetical protein
MSSFGRDNPADAEQDYVKQQLDVLSQQAPILPVDNNLSLARYVGSAKQLLSQVCREIHDLHAS